MSQTVIGGKRAHVLMIDNYDSFTFNLVQGLAELGASVHVFRHDEISVVDARAMAPTHVVISPGPGRPEGAGVSVPMIAEFEADTPVLGVCLGHQCIVQHYGGTIVSAERLMHGKTSAIKHDGQALFADIEQPMEVGRYHSLCAEEAALPDVLEATATTERGELMGVRHREHAVEGVQFHPESVLTPDGQKLLDNFLRITA